MIELLDYSKRVVRIGAWGIALAIVHASALSYAQGKALDKLREQRENPDLAREEMKREDPDDRSKEPRTSVGAVPIAGGDSDIGFGIGEVSEIAHRVPGYEPYRWRVENTAFITFSRENERIRVPYQDYYVLFTVPDLIPNRLRLEIRPSYTHETTQKYYGLGNASKVGPISDPRDSYYEYGRIHPTMLVRARLRMAPKWFLEAGIAYTHNWIDRKEDTKLTEQMRTGTPEIRSLLGQTKSHGVAFFEYALLHDSRDNETSAHRGQYHQVKLRLSPGGTDWLPYRYGQANATFRFYASPVQRYLTVAIRTVADIQFGNPPFYELARFENTFALGGSLGVRGVPAQRYYGKVKFFGNVELRSELFDFRMFGKALGFGIATFFDAGRLFADLKRQPALDGTGIGLKYGLGGGLRLKQGKTFVIRLDVAYSPDARPIGVYFGAGQIF